MILHREAKATLTPFHLNHGDGLCFRRSDGSEWELTLLETTAEVLARCAPGGDTRDPGHSSGEIASYGFHARVRINGREHVLRRVVGTQESFYEPWDIDGVRLWFDAAACAFQPRGGFMAEKDWLLGFVCQPPAAARFAVQESNRAICPEPPGPWYPCPSGRIDIRDCYTGADCWMGPYNGGAAHCGLDVNMPAGTVLTAPISFDHQYLFHSSEGGFGTNRWRGLRRWPDGSEWRLQCHHQGKMLVPERTPLAAGTPYATGAETGVGLHPHAHFMFNVTEQGGQYWLDPWIFFREIFRGRRQEGHK